MLPDNDVSRAVRRLLAESDTGMVDMELVEYICTLKDSGIDTDEFRSCLIELFREYNKEQFLDEK